MTVDGKSKRTATGRVLPIAASHADRLLSSWLQTYLIARDQQGAPTEPVSQRSEEISANRTLAAGACVMQNVYVLYMKFTETRLTPEACARN